MEQTSNLDGALRRAALAKFGGDLTHFQFWQFQIDDFHKKVEIRATGFQEPVQIKRALIDVSIKEHTNQGSEKDAFEINTEEQQHKSQGTGYSFSVTKGLEVGGNANIGANIFNVASVGVGLSGKGSKSTTRGAELKCDTVLSKRYGIVDKIEVPPGCKVPATIKTYAVTYAGSATVEVSAPADFRFNVRYRRRRCCNYCFGVCTLCFGMNRGILTARDLFQMQDGFHEKGNVVYYTAEYSYSYLGDLTDVQKDEQPLALNTNI